MRFLIFLVLISLFGCSHFFVKPPTEDEKVQLEEAKKSAEDAELRLRDLRKERQQSESEIKED